MSRRQGGSIMNIQIKANVAIDILIDRYTNYMDTYNKFYLRDKSRGEINRISDKYYAVSSEISSIADILGINYNSIEHAARMAFKWYNRTKWEFCLSGATAEKLLQAAHDGLFDIPKEREAGYYLAWHQRNLAWRSERSA